MRNYILVSLLQVFALLFTAQGYAFTNAENRKAASWYLVAAGKNYEDIKGDLAKLNARVAEDMSLKELETAFTRLQACRTIPKYKSNPLPLVAAEHYAYMRYQTAEYGDEKFMTLPKEYYDIKVELQKAGNLNWLRSTDQNVSPPNKGTLNWGNLGAKQGIADFKRLKPDAEPVLGEAESLLERAKLAQSHWIYSWLQRNIGSGLYANNDPSKCYIVEPKN